MKFMTMDIYEKGLCDQNSKMFKLYSDTCKTILNNYKKAKRRLPNNFIEIYENNYYFHDTNILKIIVQNDENNNKDVIIEFGDYNELSIYKIYYKNAQYFSNNINFKIKYGVINKAINCVLASEFIIEKKYVIHNMLLVGGSEINIKFEKINIEII